MLFRSTPAQVAEFEAGDVVVECALPTYLEAAALTPDTKSELLRDLLP